MKGKIFKLAVSCILAQLIEALFTIIFVRFIPSSTLSIVNTLIKTLIDSMLFMSVYRIVFEERGIIYSYYFDNFNIFAFIGYLNLNFILYLVSYLLGFGGGANIIEKAILISTNFVLIFVPMLGLKGNTSLFSAARESVRIIQEDSKALFGLFIVVVLVGWLQPFASPTLIYLTMSMITSFYSFIIFITPHYFIGTILWVIMDIFGMMLTALGIVMVQKYCEYR